MSIECCLVVVIPDWSVENRAAKVIPFLHLVEKVYIPAYPCLPKLKLFLEYLDLSIENHSI